MFNDTKLIESDTDLGQFVSELKTPWKTMGTDMDTALTIITNHAKTEIELERLELVSIRLYDQSMQLNFPNWQSEVEQAFIDQYGLNHGKLIFNKVMMRLFLMAKGEAQRLH